MSEIIADVKPHVPGEREVVNWTRPDGQTYFDVPLVYMREVSERDYRENFPRASLPPGCCFWEVSID